MPGAGVQPGGAGQAAVIRALAGDAGLSPAELAGFEKAEDASSSLTITGNKVMNLVDNALLASDGEYALEGETLEAMLRLHGTEYHATRRWSRSHW